MSDPTKLLSRVAYYLDDYAELMEEVEYEYDKGEINPVPELKDLAKKMKELCGDWEEKRAFGNAKNAGFIIHDMLKGWRLPGAVWFHPKTKRFRLVGEGYRPEKEEELMGVYLPDVDPKFLQADLKCVLDEHNTQS